MPLTHQRHRTHPQALQWPQPSDTERRRERTRADASGREQTGHTNMQHERAAGGARQAARGGDARRGDARLAARGSRRVHTAGGARG